MAIAIKNFASIACRDLAGTATCLLIASGTLHPGSEVLRRERQRKRRRAADRNRRPRRRPRAREETDNTWLTWGPFPSRFKERSRSADAKNPTECEHIRRLPCGQLFGGASDLGAAGGRTRWPSAAVSATVSWSAPDIMHREPLRRSSLSIGRIMRCRRAAGKRAAYSP
jgi:hypothetical protein